VAHKFQQNRLWAVINSPFFLWLMSLIILTVGGYMAVAHQQCTNDALDEISHAVKIQREYIMRENHIRDIVFGHGTIESIQTHLNEPYNYYPEFKDYPTGVIREQYDGYKDRIINTGPAVPPRETGIMRPIEDGVLPPNLKDSDVPNLRKYINSLQKNLPNPNIGLYGKTILQPSCGILSLLIRAIYGNQARIVQGPIDIEWSFGPLRPEML
jgi:hypothetical protein